MVKLSSLVIGWRDRMVSFNRHNLCVVDFSRELIHGRSSITPIKETPPGFDGAGYGRIVRFQAPQLLGTICERIQNLLGNLSGLSIAVPQTVQPKHKPLIKISSVGICAGSGGSLLNGLDVDLLFTGELS